MRSWDWDNTHGQINISDENFSRDKQSEVKDNEDKVGAGAADDELLDSCWWSDVSAASSLLALHVSALDPSLRLRWRAGKKEEGDGQRPGIGERTEYIKCGQSHVKGRLQEE